MGYLANFATLSVSNIILWTKSEEQARNTLEWNELHLSKNPIFLPASLPVKAA